ncbi:YolD-like family protein [Metabacillus halosaccharovorans]|uniref:YolD-like family protein n=1 Tax=Metabacillus halosaccharovorans TaxID=930124 RepID=A0ABT3DHS5_9BACI|nr:YolD-like family protein [Metabacillus halosaccharovorans]MCV9886227.1 YolD-like family protein [Metabacillus halosaccharovorans]
MIKDRGSIKWTSMMLPEHVKLLRDFDKSQEKIEKPILDEHQIEEINQIICEAMEHNKELVFTYYDYGEIKLYVGHIHYLDTIRKELRLKDGPGDRFNLKFEDIIRVDYSEK